MSPNTLVVLTALITALSTLGAVLITSIINLRTTRMSKESEERRHTREVIINAAIENWKHNNELWLNSRHAVSLPPVDAFILHMAATVDVFFDPTTNAHNLKQRLDEVEKLVDIVGQSLV